MTDYQHQISKNFIAWLIVLGALLLMLMAAGCTTPTLISFERTDSEGAYTKAIIQGMPKDWKDLYLRYGTFELRAGAAVTVEPLGPLTDLMEEVVPNAMCAYSPLFCATQQ